MRIVEIDPTLLNRWIVEHGCIGRVFRKWAWWMNEDGSRGLAPCHGTRYLYRGQNRRYWSVTPSISRGLTTRAAAVRDLQPDEQLRVLLAMIRTDWYCQLLKTHPVFTWAKEQRFEIDRMALAQHYELPTGYIDLTESIEIALFFACCRFRGGQWEPLSDGKGILYRLDWIATQDQIGPRIKAIGLQPFARPNAQWAWTMEMRLHENFEDVPGLEAVTFNHKRQLGEKLLDVFDGGKKVMPPDPLFDWAVSVKQATVLSLSSALDLLTDISQDEYGILIPDMQHQLDRLAQFGNVTFATDSPKPFNDLSIAAIADTWEAIKPQFADEMEKNTQLWLVRTPKKSDSGAERFE